MDVRLRHGRLAAPALSPVRVVELGSRIEI
jgi:hypothetical protein